MDLVKAWLEDDMDTCINRKKDEFIAVFRGIARSLDPEMKDPAALLMSFCRSMGYHWFEKIFRHGDKNGPLSKGPNLIIDALADIINDDQSQLKNKMTGIAKFVLAEDEQKKPDSRQKVINRK